MTHIILPQSWSERPVRKPLPTDFESLLKLSRVAHVENRLRKAGIIPTNRTAIIEQWKQHKQAEVDARRAKRVGAEQWQPLVKDFQDEVSRTRAAIKAANPDDFARIACYSQYLDCLMRHRAAIQLLALKAGTRTPRDYAVQKGLPNTGATWPDWINPTERAHIEDAHARVPKPKTGRLMPIFKVRRMPAQTEARIKRFNKELAAAILAAQRNIQSAPAHAEYHEALLTALRNARAKLDEYEREPAGKPRLPATYFGLFTPEDRLAMSEAMRPTQRKAEPDERRKPVQSYEDRLLG